MFDAREANNRTYEVSNEDYGWFISATNRAIETAIQKGEFSCFSYTIFEKDDSYFEKAMSYYERLGYGVRYDRERNKMFIVWDTFNIS